MEFLCMMVPSEYESTVKKYTRDFHKQKTSKVFALERIHAQWLGFPGGFGGPSLEAIPALAALPQGL